MYVRAGTRFKPRLCFWMNSRPHSLSFFLSLSFTSSISLSLSFFQLSLPLPIFYLSLSLPISLSLTLILSLFLIKKIQFYYNCSVLRQYKNISTKYKKKSALCELPSSISIVSFLLWYVCGLANFNPCFHSVFWQFFLC